MYHQNKVIKTNITQIRLPCYGPNNAHNVRNVETVIQGVPLKSPPLNFSKCQIVENMAES